MPTNYCYLTDEGIPYALGTISGCKSPFTHIINYTIVPIDPEIEEGDDE